MEGCTNRPVKVNRQVPLASIPVRARRTHPSWGDPQVLTGYVLHELLEPERPADALAYVALTASDLWPGRGWNFVFGEANLRQRTGVWSIYRNGDPGASLKSVRGFVRCERCDWSRIYSRLSVARIPVFCPACGSRVLRERTPAPDSPM